MLPSKHPGHPPIHEFRYGGANDQIDDNRAKHAQQLIRYGAAINIKPGHSQNEWNQSAIDGCVHTIEH